MAGLSSAKKFDGDLVSDGASDHAMDAAATT